MGSPAETEQWKQIMERLKCRERQVRSDSNEDFNASNLIAPKLYMATRSGSMPDLLAVLGELCESRHVSDIVEKVTRRGDTILHLAAKYGKADILWHMADQFPQLIMRTNIIGDTALHVAARTMDLGLMDNIISRDLFHFGDQGKRLLRMKNEFGDTALHEAVRAFHFEGVDLLLKTDQDAAVFLNKEGKSPLYLAVETGDGRIIDLLRRPLLNPERHHASLHAIVMILSSGAQIKYRHKSLLEGWKVDTLTPVKPFSRANKILEIFSEELLYLEDQNGRTALHLAASMGNLIAVQTILKERPQNALKWDLKGYLPIHIACKKGHINVVKEFLLKPEPWFDPLDLLNKKGQNLLHIAAKNGVEKVVKYVLSEQKLEVLINERDKNGNSPLHLASKYLHPNILRLLTRDKRLKVNLVNNEGLTARDIVVFKRSTPSTLREHLAFAVLKSAGTPLTEKGRRMRHLNTGPPQIEWIKDRVKFLLLVAILIATVTFAAGFTVPGGVNSSEYKDINKIGTATLLNRKMLQLFTICDAIAMYSSTMGFSILLWAHLGDFHLASSATYVASYLVGFAVITMSVAFMAALHLVVRDVSWLADTVIAIGVIFLLIFLGGFILLIFPIGERRFFLGFISDLSFNMIIRLSESHGKLRKVKTKKEEEKDVPQQIRTERLVRQHSF